MIYLPAWIIGIGAILIIMVAAVSILEYLDIKPRSKKVRK
ncbi:hypothetical protein LCGC14_1577840 [marine sediment metagenome]|uniref:Uncharacterized protein n=1 Tax=marine sediment metagenome TaxID=412755 RepID=A0A0F9KYN1_9ZZZZ